MSWGTKLPVALAREEDRLRPGHVYVAPADFHMTVKPDHTISLVDGRRIRFLRSSVNPLFESAAAALSGRVIGVVLTGYGQDGTDGVQTIKRNRGTVIAQDRATSEAFDMPDSAINTGAADYVLPLNDIGPALQASATTLRASSRRRTRITVPFARRMREVSAWHGHVCQSTIAR